MIIAEEGLNAAVNVTVYSPLTILIHGQKPVSSKDLDLHATCSRRKSL